jgi:hypothetical protein
MNGIMRPGTEKNISANGTQDLYLVSLSFSLFSFLFSVSFSFPSKLDSSVFIFNDNWRTQSLTVLGIPMANCSPYTFGKTSNRAVLQMKYPTT